jgi:hypothetical protein
MEIPSLRDFYLVRGNVTFLDSKDYYLKCDIEGVKIDILRYRHSLIDDTLLIDGIRMVSAKDIAPMKEYIKIT